MREIKPDILPESEQTVIIDDTLPFDLSKTPTENLETLKKYLMDGEKAVDYADALIEKYRREFNIKD